MQIVMRIGVLMLRSGTVSFRVEQAMMRAALALGAERLDAYITLTGITASIHRKQQHYTQIARVKTVGVDMNRLSAVEFLALHIPPSIDADALTAKLDKIEATPPVYSLPVKIIALAIACGAFAVLNTGGHIEFCAAAIGAGIGQMLRLRLQQRRLNLIAVTVMCSAIATIGCHLTVRGFALLGWTTPNAQAGFLAAVLFLVPGMPLVTAALDLVRFDLISGMMRISYALLLMVSVALGILLALPLTGISIL
ncbi:MAG: hypothetical protein Kow00121_43210 [Elainellaceae cyanobacterium]